MTLEDPRERGRVCVARIHGPGESPTASGDGRGVMSVNAFSIGEDTADPGESELVMLAVDSAVLSVAPGIAMGAVAAVRMCAPALLSTIVGVLGDCLGSDVASCAGRSVWRCSPAAEGVRM